MGVQGTGRDPPASTLAGSQRFRWIPDGLEGAGRLVLAMLLVGGCMGCVVVPIVQEGRHVTLHWRDQARDLEKTQPTRAEVVQKLGEPQYRFSDLPVLGYQWSGVELETFWMLGLPGGDDKPVVDRLLWIGFDATDRMSCWQVTMRFHGMTTWEQAYDWSRARGLSLTLAPPRRFVPTLPPTNQAVVHLYWDKGTADELVLRVWLDGQEGAQLRRGRFTTLLLTPGAHKISVFQPPLDLELAAGEVRFLEFHPTRKTLAKETTLQERRPNEALAALKTLRYCR